jgi:predicted nucleotidyltransferase component of viral defense system
VDLVCHRVEYAFKGGTSLSKVYKVIDRLKTLI